MVVSWFSMFGVSRVLCFLALYYDVVNGNAFLLCCWVLEFTYCVHLTAVDDQMPFVARSPGCIQYLLHSDVHSVWSGSDA